MSKPEILISYSRKDIGWKEKILTHLRILEIAGLCTIWEDGKIRTGKDWRPIIDKALSNANIAILMVSADFLTSEFIQEVEIPVILERRNNDYLEVIPIIVRPCARKHVSWLAPIQYKPSNGKELSTMLESDAESAIVEIVNEIAEILKNLQPRETGEEEPQILFDKEELEKKIKTSNSELRTYKNTIAKKRIPRDEVTEITDWILSEDSKKKIGVLIDQPGGGKSVLMRSVLEKLEDSNVNVLAIKSDNIEKIKSSNDLSDRLGLPAPIEEIIQFYSNDEHTVLLIDQIDALSLSLARDQSTLDVILSIISRLHGLENITILASCRSFDINNDPKLSKIKIDRKFSIKPLSEEQIDLILNKFSLKHSDLPPSLQQLLTVPLHLELLSKVIDSKSEDTQHENFQTLHDLYGALWGKLISFTPRTAPKASKVTKAIYEVTDYMNQKQVVSVPVAVMDEYPDEATYLERTGVLRKEGNNYHFLHQTFFDYCYARRFVSKGISLSDDILQGPQGLFSRSQMPNVLAYLRNSDSKSYLREINTLLFNDKTKYHLRHLIIEWLASIPNPTQDELKTILKLLKDPDRAILFLNAAANSPGWFNLLAETYLPDILKTNSKKKINLISHYLGRSIEFHGDQVADLLTPYRKRDETWDQRIAQIIRYPRKLTGPKIIDLIQDLFRRKKTFGLERHILLDLAQTNPCASLPILRIHLDNSIDILREKLNDPENESSSFKQMWDGEDLIDEYGIRQLMVAALVYCPDLIIEHILPWFLEVIQEFSQDSFSADQYLFDSIFSYGWYDEFNSGGPKLAMSLIRALGSVSKENPKLFLDSAKEIQTSKIQSAHLVLARSYLENPEPFGKEIAQYLLADSRRLNISDPIEGGRYESIQLINAAFLYSDKKHQKQLEDLVLSFESEEDKKLLEKQDLDKEYKREILKRQDYTKYLFLKNIPKELLSDKTIKIRDELERKFPNATIEPPQGISFGFVGSPIDDETLPLLSDNNLISAMQKYDDSSGWGNDRENYLKGGIIQLSRSFTELGKKDPKRYYKLALKFDETIPTMYKKASIISLAESDAPSEWAFDLVTKFHIDLNSEDRKEVCRAISKRAEDNVPNSILEVLQDWAVNDLDPEKELWNVTPEGSDTPYYQGDPYSHGINCTRGTAIQTFCKSASKKDPPQSEEMFQLLEISANDESTAVRSIVIQQLAYMLNFDPDRAINLFEQTLIDHPQLLNIRQIYNFLYYARHHDLNRTLLYIKELLKNDNERTREGGAMLMCLAFFSNPNLSSNVTDIIRGDKNLRLGASKIFSRNIESNDSEAISKKNLLLLINDPDLDIRKQIGISFHNMREEQFPRLRDFIDAFCNSPSLPSGISYLVQYLLKISYDYPEYVLDKMDIIISLLEQPTNTKQDNIDLFENDLVKLPLAVYTHTDDENLQSKAIDLFERLLKMNFYFAKNALADWDRR